MVSSGDYILPHRNGDIYAEKPPAFFWAAALVRRVTRIPFESAPRFVSFLSALGTLLLTFRLGEKLADARTGWLAVLVLATTPLFVVHAVTGVIDGTLLFLVTAAVYAGVTARTSGSPVHWGLFYLTCAAAVLVKGPVGLIIPATVLLVCSVRSGGAAGWPASHALWGTLLVLSVVGAWLAPAVAQGGADYAEAILIRQNLGRAFNPWHHAQPFYYYLKTLPSGLFPWVLLLPAAIATAWRRVRQGKPGDDLPQLVLVWAGFTLLFFSLLAGKKARYMTIMLPAVSLMIALWLRPGMKGKLKPAARIPLVVCGSLFMVAAVVLAALSLGTGGRFIDQIPQLSDLQRLQLRLWFEPPGSLVFLLPAVVVGLLSAWGTLRLMRGRGEGFAGLAAGAAVLVGGLVGLVCPALDVVKSARTLARQVRMIAEGDSGTGEVFLYRRSFGGVFNVYLDRERLAVLPGDPEEAARLMTGHAGAVVVTRADDFAPLSAAVPSLVEMGCQRYGAKAICAGQLKPPISVSR